MTIHDSDRDFDQFRHFDRPVSPSIATLSTLRHRLASTSETRAITASSQVGSKSSLAPAPSAGWTQSVNRRRIRTWRAAAAILAFLLAASTLVISLQPEERARLAFQPEPTAERDVNPAGTIGRTWQVGDQNPIVGSPVWSRYDPRTMGLRGTVFVDGSVIVDLFPNAYVDRFPTEGQERTLARLDLETGEIYWQNDLFVTGIYAANETYAFGFWVPNPDRPQETQLIAIDHGTGDVAWRGPTLAERSFGSGATAVVDGDTVYAVDFMGNLVSVNAVTGAQNWQFPEQLRFPTAGDDAPEGGIFLFPQLAVDQDSAFIVRPDQSVVKVDRVTGQQVGVINVIDEYAAMARGVEVAVSESFLLVMALAPFDVSESFSVSYRANPTELLVFDRHTLDHVGRVSIQDLRGMVAIQGDTAFVPMSDGDPFSRSDNTWNPRSRVDAIDLESLAVISQIVGIDGGRQLLLSLAGTTLIVPRATGTIDFYALPTMQKTESITIDVPESEFAFLFPVQMDGTTPVVIGSIGEIYLLNGPPIAATPETAASPAS